jgi:hypothetical protein
MNGNLIGTRLPSINWIGEISGEKNYNNNNLDLKLVQMISENLTQQKNKK